LSVSGCYTYRAANNPSTSVRHHAMAMRASGIYLYTSARTCY
jgi:hypothetical protein